MSGLKPVRHDLSLARTDETLRQKEEEEKSPWVQSEGLPEVDELDTSLQVEAQYLVWHRNSTGDPDPGLGLVHWRSDQRPHN